jgi:hypothetical protein
MNDEPESTRTLKQRWDEEDAARDKQEERAQQAFLEAEANHTFAPIEDFLIRLSKVLSAAGPLMEIDTTWEHLGERRLRRVAKVISFDSLHRLPLDFTISAASIFYCDKIYRLATGIEALRADWRGRSGQQSELGIHLRCYEAQATPVVDRQSYLSPMRERMSGAAQNPANASGPRRPRAHGESHRSSHCTRAKSPMPIAPSHIRHTNRSVVRSSALASSIR